MPIDTRPILGAILGDIAGSAFEGIKIIGDTFETATLGEFSKYFAKLHGEDNITKTEDVFIKDFPLLNLPGQRFTDDTVLTMAQKFALDTNFSKPNHKQYALAYKLFANRYPDAGYGAFFKEWMQNLDINLINSSFGNGAAMRTSPVACYGFSRGLSLAEVGIEAEIAAISTHSHEDGLNGAKAIAKTIYMAMQKKPKGDIQKYIEDNFHYDLTKTIDEYRAETKGFTSDAIKTVPVAIRAFLEGNSTEEAIRRAISFGGDTDTIASMAGAISAGYYGIPPNLVDHSKRYLDPNLFAIIS